MDEFMLILFSSTGESGRRAACYEQLIAWLEIRRNQAEAGGARGCAAKTGA
jgi:hypothetical protein